MFKKALFFPLCAGILFACSPANEEKKETDTAKTESKDSIPSVQAEKKKLPYDTLLTETSRFIAGLPVQTLLNDQQSKDYYKQHADFAEASWKTTTDSMLVPVRNWCADKKIGDTRDSLLCFYPLSGPDFLFANTFFPQADNYIMLGLEPRGSMVDFRNLNDTEINKYLSGVRQSMKYLNSRGYFVTSHMSSDFTRAHLNGMLHMILYMMARTEHPIVDVYDVYIDSSGLEHRLEKGMKAHNDAPLAIKIEFLSPDKTEKRNAYYFKLNASDEYLDKHPEFEKFVNAFGSRVSYMKSASCVLQNTPFSVMRKLVLQSDKVLQDDTGVPYKYFTADSTFNVTLYGTYSKTIDDLNWCMQPTLKKDLENSPEKGHLPYRISYNGNYGEGMMIWAVRK